MSLARETKVGLVVAVSFLCLVGVVVAARLRNSQDPNTADAATTKITPGSVAQADLKGGKPSSKPIEPSSGQGTQHAPAAPGSAPNLLPSSLNPGPGKSSPAPPARPGAEPSGIVIPEPEPFPPAVVSPSPAPALPSPGINVDEELQKQIRINSGSQTNPKHPASPRAVEPFPPASSPAGHPNPANVNNPPAAPALAQAPSGPPANSPSPTSKPAVPADPPGPIPISPLPVNNSGLASNPSAPATIPPNANSPSGPSGSGVHPPSNAGPSSPPAFPPSNASGNANSPNAPTAPPNPGPSPVVPNAISPTVLGPIGTPPAPGTPGSPANAPTNPNASSAPKMTPAAPAGAPIVRDWDVKPYHCMAQEASFADVSRALYGSDKYAKALLLFNRNYPLAGDHVRQEPPQLRPGQVVFFPPVDVLQAQYPGEINDAAPRAAAPTPTPGAAPGAGSGPTSPSVSISVGQPMPLTPGPGNPSALAFPPPGTPANSPASADVRMYRVHEGGEPILQIAQSTLGDRNRWPEIYRLNPSIDPRYPIPAGVEIRLPATARLP